MNWQDIRKYYPEQWLLVEAVKARSEAGKRILEQISVINAYTDSLSAMKGYKTLKHEAPERELFVFHTSREDLDVSERQWLGIRGIQLKYAFKTAC